VTLLARAKRQGRQLLAIGLRDPYREILELTRLERLIPIYTTESEALATMRAAA